jgi:hypothetical protein
VEGVTVDKQSRLAVTHGLKEVKRSQRHEGMYTVGLVEGPAFSPACVAVLTTMACTQATLLCDNLQVPLIGSKVSPACNAQTAAACAVLS